MDYLMLQSYEQKTGDVTRAFTETESLSPAIGVTIATIPCVRNVIKSTEVWSLHSPTIPLK